MAFTPRLHALALLWLAGATLTATPAASPPHPVREVLPGNIVPIHYDLTLSPDPDALVFRGKVLITIDVHTATQLVTLNAVNLAFDHATLDGARWCRDL